MPYRGDNVSLSGDHRDSQRLTTVGFPFHLGPLLEVVAVVQVKVLQEVAPVQLDRLQEILPAIAAG